MSDQCCTKGLIGRHEGEGVFCTCPQGLDAEMTHLANLMQPLAAFMEEYDAGFKVRTLSDIAHQTAIVVAPLLAQHIERYDELERGWIAL